MIQAGARHPEHSRLIVDARIDYARSVRSQRIDPRSTDEIIFNHALASVQTVKASVKSLGCHDSAPQTEQELHDYLNRIARAAGARPVPDEISMQGRIGRMLNPLWWSRNLRRELLQLNEKQEHQDCQIRRKKQVYCSDFAVQTKRRRAKKSREVLEGLEVVNQDGEAFNLQEVADASVSNPKLRRAELMTRCRGFEETAKFMRHVGMLLTITCPSRFHRYGGDGRANPKWSGETPKDGQEYLCKVWQRTRAAWARKGFFPYGFRATEPHHDGCPHWHILIFCAADEVGGYSLASKQWSGVVGLAAKHAFRESPDERGAAEHRFDVEMIDEEKGSATGYMAKYICKNIDGQHENGDSMGLDFDSGKSAIEASERVRVWAQTWGIRQFQQVGGPSVTVWRELRKLDTEQPLQNELFEGPRAAADRALWALFWVLQGGPDVKRKDLTLKPWYVADKTGQYGDEIERVYGVTGNDGSGAVGLQTRLHTWEIQRDGVALCDLYEAVRIDTRASEDRIAVYMKNAGIEYTARHYRVDEPEPVPESAPVGAAWTRVNNCTVKHYETADEIDAAFDELENTRGGGPYAAKLADFRGWGQPERPRNANSETRSRHRDGQHGPH